MYATILVAVDLAKPDARGGPAGAGQELCDTDGLIRLLHVLPGPVTDTARAQAMAALLSLGGGMTGASCRCCARARLPRIFMPWHRR